MANWWEAAPVENAPANSDNWWTSAPLAKATTKEIAADIAKSGSVGLGKGAIGVTTAIGDIASLLGYGASYAGAKGMELAGMLPKGKTAKDFMDATGNLNKQLQAAPPPPSGSPIENALATVARGSERFFTPATSSEIQQRIEKDITGPFYKPKTTPGKYAETIGEFIPGAMTMPGQTLPNVAKFGVGLGTAAETIGQATDQNPWARAAGTGALGVLMAAFGRPNVAQRMVSTNAGATTPAQFDAAERLMREAAARGVTITTAEAIQAATGGSTGMGALQRIAESTPEGTRILGPVMANRPNQMQAAVQSELTNIAPPISRPYDVAPQVQKIGEQAMQAAERLRSNRAGPYYQAASTETVNPNAVASIVRQMEGVAAADTTGILANPVNKTAGLLVSQPGQAASSATRTPVIGPNGQVIRYEMTPARAATEPTLANDIPNLDRARKFVREQTELPAFAADAIPKEQGRVIGDLMSALRDRMERNSPNFREGRLQYETASRNIVEPFTNSPTGQLATAATPEAQRAVLFPPNPLPNSQRAIGNAFESIGNRNPDLPNQLLRQEIERRANTTVNAMDTAGRPDQYGGARFARDMQSNPQFAANMNEAMSRSGVNPSSLNSLMEVLGATGWRQRPGSMTAFNQEALGDMKRGGVNALVQALAKPAARAQETVGRMRLAGQAEKLSELLASGPEGLARIREIARTGTGNERALAQAIISSSPELARQ